MEIRGRACVAEIQGKSLCNFLTLDENYFYCKSTNFILMVFLSLGEFLKQNHQDQAPARPL